MTGFWTDCNAISTEFLLLSRRSSSPQKVPCFRRLVEEVTRDVTNFLSCRIDTTSRRGINELGICFGSIFLLCSYESSQGPHSQQPGEIPSPWPLITALGNLFALWSDLNSLFLNQTTVSSLLMDTSLRQTLRVVPAFLYSFKSTLYEMDSLFLSQRCLS